MLDLDPKSLILLITVGIMYQQYKSWKMICVTWIGIVAIQGAKTSSTNTSMHQTSIQAYLHCINGISKVCGKLISGNFPSGCTTEDAHIMKLKFLMRSW